MVYSSISRIEIEVCNPSAELTRQLNSSSSSVNLTAQDPNECKLGIAISLAFWCGIFQVNFFKDYIL